MAGDYTKFRFSPAKDAAGILMQQGRVMLDQDWNELVELLDRRWRTETLDIIGRAVVPRQTPDAFKIRITPANDLTIGCGRIYVDGLLAENHGASPLQYDPVLGEQAGTQPISYESQPYFRDFSALPLPNPFVLPQPPDNGPHLVYLDVWQREVTYLEDPGLVDQAVAVDTGTRLQTAWQVKVLKDVGAVDCSTKDGSITGWAAVIAPSAGQVTTAAAGVPASTDPCSLPPNTGYRGAENRLYRVEIHQPGALGTAQFKWSRDNASVASPVTAINATGDTLTVVRTKRDAVLRFSPGDWVEVTDDLRELGGLPGDMRKVKFVDDVNLTIQLTAPVTLPPAPAGFNAKLPARHTRVVRWNQKGIVLDPNGNQIVDVDANGGLIPVKANTTVVLGDGVQVSFSLDPAISGGQFLLADYWVFAARVVDASVELLDHAPPRGIHHHYARLAVITFPASAPDCRVFWPPEFGGGCDCGACVTADEHNQGLFTIQMAIDQVKSTGGKVCLGPGIYTLQDTVLVAGAKALEIAGHGGSTLVVPPVPAGASPKPAILIDGSLNVTLDGLAVTGVTFQQPSTPAGGRATFAPVAAPRAGPVLLRPAPPVGVFVPPSPPVAVVGGSTGAPPSAPTGTAPPPATAGAPPTTVVTVPPPVQGAMVMVQNSSGVTIERCAFTAQSPQIADYAAIGLGGFLLGTTIRENVITSVLGPNFNFGIGVAHFGTIADKSNPVLLALGLDIADNAVACGSDGIVLSVLCWFGGDIRVAGNTILGCAIAGIGVVGMPLSADPVSTRLDIVGNEVLVAGNGIVTSMDWARIAENDITGSKTAPAGNGILIVPPGAAARKKQIDGCQIVGNRISGVGAVGIAIQAGLGSAIIKQNLIEAAGAGGILMRGAAFADHVSVANNQLLGLAPSGSAAALAKTQLAAAISLQLVASAEIEGNLVRDLGLDPASNMTRVGIAAIACHSVRIAGNQVVNVGPPAAAMNPSAGIAVITPQFDRVDVAGNIVRRNLQAPAPDTTAWCALYVGPIAFFTQTFGYTVAPGKENVAYIVDGTNLYQIREGMQRTSVQDNYLEAYGSAPAAQIAVAGPGNLGENQCFLRFIGEVGPGVVSVRAASVIAGNNTLQGGSPALAISTQRYTVLGNITGGGTILVNGTALAAPWVALNQ
ncbi:MAG TPA: DUF6519 domain-containing protein [Candidatus Acidoferrales bacterium]|nr:DUF6519 domain-containing protein [Candidatus Acidoferrales bacterium]